MPFFPVSDSDLEGSAVASFLTVLSEFCHPDMVFSIVCIVFLGSRLCWSNQEANGPVDSFVKDRPASVRNGQRVSPGCGSHLAECSWIQPRQGPFRYYTRSLGLRSFVYGFVIFFPPQCKCEMILWVCLLQIVRFAIERVRWRTLSTPSSERNWMKILRRFVKRSKSHERQEVWSNNYCINVLCRLKQPHPGDRNAFRIICLFVELRLFHCTVYSDLLPRPSQTAQTSHRQWHQHGPTKSQRWTYSCGWYQYKCAYCLNT